MNIAFAFATTMLGAPTPFLKSSARYGPCVFCIHEWYRNHGSPLSYRSSQALKVKPEQSGPSPRVFGSSGGSPREPGRRQAEDPELSLLLGPLPEHDQEAVSVRLRKLDLAELRRALHDPAPDDPRAANEREPGLGRRRTHDDGKTATHWPSGTRQ